MANMSYCRFESTSRALRDCFNALNEGETDEFSEYESQGCNDLIALCKKIVEDHGDFVAHPRLTDAEVRMGGPRFESGDRPIEDIEDLEDRE